MGSVTLLFRLVFISISFFSSSVPASVLLRCVFYFLLFISIFTFFFHLTGSGSFVLPLNMSSTRSSVSALERVIRSSLVVTFTCLQRFRSFCLAPHEGSGGSSVSVVTSVCWMLVCGVGSPVGSADSGATGGSVTCYLCLLDIGVWCWISCRIR